MKVWDNGAAKARAVWSADWTYLLFGIIGIVLAVAFEVVAVSGFFISPIGEAVALAVPMQIAVLFVLLLTVHLSAYKRRAQFLLYFCKIEDVDIRAVKEKYHICFIDEYGVLFVEKADVRLFNDWEMKYTISSARESEEKLFMEDNAEAARV